MVQYSHHRSTDADYCYAIDAQRARHTLRGHPSALDSYSFNRGRRCRQGLEPDRQTTVPVLGFLARREWCHSWRPGEHLHSNRLGLQELGWSKSTKGSLLDRSKSTCQRCRDPDSALLCQVDVWPFSRGECQVIHEPKRPRWLHKAFQRTDAANASVCAR